MKNFPATTILHPSPPPTLITISDPNNPYPTTFVQADTTSFNVPPPIHLHSTTTTQHRLHNLVQKEDRNKTCLKQQLRDTTDDEIGDRRESDKLFCNENPKGLEGFKHKHSISSNSLTDLELQDVSIFDDFSDDFSEQIAQLTMLSLQPLSFTFFSRLTVTLSSGACLVISRFLVLILRSFNRRKKDPSNPNTVFGGRRRRRKS
ncbi:hypothetical protein QVD17_21050 [Tagetes erecta]|uniref:Transmembrane protein n=1 Tax=Tagetes erecta TaxID=13708 RepID=A0AAD8KTX4_TARER|nr:hypothetical protein QVD17_21050 [Tagetes erecta]